MSSIGIFWHGVVLRHGGSTVEFSFRADRRHGVLAECPCGKRWLTRAPWFRPVKG